MVSLKKILQAVARWLGRGTSLVVLAFLLLFLVGEGLPPLTLKSLCFPFGLMLGLVLAWRWEGVGGALALACFAAFYALEYTGHGRFPRGPYFLIAAAPSFFFLLSSFLRHRGPGISVN